MKVADIKNGDVVTFNIRKGAGPRTKRSRLWAPSFTCVGHVKVTNICISMHPYRISCDVIPLLGCEVEWPRWQLGTSISIDLEDNDIEDGKVISGQPPMREDVFNLLDDQ